MDDEIENTEETFSPVAETETPKKRKSAVKKTAKKAVAKKAVAKKKKAVKKAAVKKSAVKNSKAKKNGGGSKMGEKRKRNGAIGKIVSLLQQKRGTTREAILKATGWKAVSPKQVAEGAGLKLKTDKSERPYRYQAA